MEQSNSEQGLQPGPDRRGELPERDNDTNSTNQLSMSELDASRAGLWDDYEADMAVNKLERVVELDEQILTMCPAGHPRRARACMLLAQSLGLHSVLVAVHTPDITNADDSSSEHLGLVKISREALWVEYEETRDVNILQDIIDLDEQALSLFNGRDVNRVKVCWSLSNSLMLHLRRREGQDDTHLNVRHLTDSMYADSLAEPAARLWDRYKRNGDPELLKQFIAIEVAILDALSEADPNRFSTCTNLAMSLRLQYAQGDDVSVLKHAIQRTKEAYALCPVMHKRRAEICVDLAICLLNLYTHIGNGSLIDEAAKFFREALALHPPGHPDRAKLCGNLALSLKMRYAQTGDTHLLDEATDLERKALVLRSPDHPDRAESCLSLAGSLRTRYTQTSYFYLLDEAIDLEREALSLLPPGDPGRAKACSSLAVSLKTRYAQTGVLHLLDEATKLEREALALRPPGHTERAKSCINLAVTLSTHYAQTGDLHLLDEATNLEREALSSHPPGHPDRAKSCSNLAVSLRTHYAQTGDVRLLDEAIELEREAMALRLPGDSDRSKSYINLALLLWTRYGQAGDVCLLDKAIEHFRQGLALCPLGHPDRATSCSNLAVSLTTRYEQTGDALLLNEVIQLGREALALRPPSHPDRAGSCVNLANSLMARYAQTGDDDLLDEAIKLNRDALASHHPGHPDRAKSCSNLAGCLTTRYAQTDDVLLLDETTRLDREALALHPPGHPDRAASCSSLAVSLTSHYDRTGDVQFLHEATELFREALALRPIGHPHRAASCINLAESLKICHVQNRDNSVLNEAMELCNQASQLLLPPQLWRSLSLQCSLLLQDSTSDFARSRAVSCLHESSRLDPDDIKTFIFNFVSHFGGFWAFHSEWTSDLTSSLATIYFNIINKLPLLAGFALDTSSRLLALRWFSQLGSQACIVAIEAKQPSRAVELLDHAQGVIWAQALHQRDPQLVDVPPELASELTVLLRGISVPLDMVAADSHLMPQDRRHEQNSRIQALLGEIRTLPGLDRFMRGSTFETLRQVADRHPVVVIAAFNDQVYAVIITRSSHKPDVLDLSPRFDQRAQQTESLRTPSADDSSKLRSELIDDRRDWEEFQRFMRPAGYRHSLDRGLQLLWKIVVKPILAHMGLERMEEEKRPRLHWCPTGRFTSLPLHAAGVYTGPNQECSSDYIVASYTPTLASLLRAQRDSQKTPVRNANLMLMSASNTSSGRFIALPNVNTEINLVSDIALSVEAHPHSLSQAGSTNEEMARALKSASIVHIACHGTQDPKDPLQSAFHLSGNRSLTVSDLMKLDLKHAHLAFLSACETAKGDEKQPDQAIHLAATMLFVGFRSVVGTMWTMRDADGPTIAQLFYDKLFKNETISNDDIPRALDHAVRGLRERKVPLEGWATFMHVGA